MEEQGGTQTETLGMAFKMMMVKFMITMLAVAVVMVVITV